MTTNLLLKERLVLTPGSIKHSVERFVMDSATEF